MNKIKVTNRNRKQAAQLAFLNLQLRHGQAVFMDVQMWNAEMVEDLRTYIVQNFESLSPVELAALYAEIAAYQEMLIESGDHYETQK